MPRFYSPNNIQSHAAATLTASVIDAWETFGASGLTPAADNVLVSLSGGTVNATTCPGLVACTVQNKSVHPAFVTFRDPTGLTDSEVVEVPAGTSPSFALAGHAGVDRVYTKGHASGSSIGVTLYYTQVSQ